MSGIEDILGPKPQDSAPSTSTPEVGGSPSMPSVSSTGSGGGGIEDILGPKPAPGSTPEVPTASPPNDFGFNAFAQHAQAFGAHMPLGFAEIPEHYANISNWMYRNHPIAGGAAALLAGPAGMQMAAGAPALDKMSRGFNQYMGQDETTPIDITSPIEDMYGTRELMNKSPVASWAGGIAGSALFPFPGGGAGAPIQGGIKEAIKQGAMRGLAPGAAFGGFAEAGREAKENGRLDPLNIAASAGIGGAFGGMLGGGAHGAGKALGMAVGRAFPRWFPTVTPKSHRIEQKIITPGPSEQRHLNALQGRVERTEAAPEAVQAGMWADEPVAPRKSNKPKIRMTREQAMTGVSRTEEPPKLPGKTVTIGDDWRDFRRLKGRAATAQERELLRSLKAKKKLLDRARSRAKQAADQLLKDMNVKPVTQRKSERVSPEQREEIARIAQELGGVAEPHGKPYVHSAYAAAVHVPFKYKSTNIKGKLEEFRKLVTAWKTRHNDYRKEADAVREKLPFNETITVDEPGGGRLQVEHTQNSRYKFADKNREAEYHERRKSLEGHAEERGDLSPKGVVKAIEADSETMAQLEHYGIAEWFRDVTKGTSALYSDPLGIVGTVRMVKATAKLARANGIKLNPAETFAKSMKAVKDSGGKATAEKTYKAAISQLANDIKKYTKPFELRRSMDFVAEQSPELYKRLWHAIARETAAGKGVKFSHGEEPLVELSLRMDTNGIRSGANGLHKLSAEQRAFLSARREARQEAAKAVAAELKKLDANHGEKVHHYSDLKTYRQILQQIHAHLTGSAQHSGTSEITDVADIVANATYDFVFKWNPGYHGLNRLDPIIFGSSAVGPGRIGAAQYLLTASRLGDKRLWKYIKSFNVEGVVEDVRKEGRVNTPPNVFEDSSKPAKAYAAIKGGVKRVQAMLPDIPSVQYNNQDIMAAAFIQYGDQNGYKGGGIQFLKDLSAGKVDKGQQMEALIHALKVNNEINGAGTFGLDKDTIGRSPLRGMVQLVGQPYRVTRMLKKWSGAALKGDKQALKNLIIFAGVSVALSGRGVIPKEVEAVWEAADPQSLYATQDMLDQVNLPAKLTGRDLAEKLRISLLPIISGTQQAMAWDQIQQILAKHEYKPDEALKAELIFMVSALVGGGGATMSKVTKEIGNVNEGIKKEYAFPDQLIRTPGTRPLNSRYREWQPKDAVRSVAMPGEDVETANFRINENRAKRSDGAFPRREQ